MTTTRTLWLSMKTIRAKQAKGHFPHFIQLDQHRIVKHLAWRKTPFRGCCHGSSLILDGHVKELYWNKFKVPSTNCSFGYFEANRWLWQLHRKMWSLPSSSACKMFTNSSSMKLEWADPRLRKKIKQLSPRAECSSHNWKASHFTSWNGQENREMCKSEIRY